MRRTIRRPTQPTAETRSSNVTHPSPPNHWIVLAAAWLAVGLPLLWGVAQTIKKALPLFV